MRKIIHSYAQRATWLMIHTHAFCVYNVRSPNIYIYIYVYIYELYISCPKSPGQGTDKALHSDRLAPVFHRKRPGFGGACAFERGDLDREERFFSKKKPGFCWRWWGGARVLEWPTRRGKSWASWSNKSVCVLQCVAVCCNALLEHHGRADPTNLHRVCKYFVRTDADDIQRWYSVLQYVAVCCSVVKSVALWCSVLQRKIVLMHM